MAVLKCKMCGGTLEVTKDEKIVTCEFCGTTQTIPTIDSEKKTLLYNRANAFRLRNEFDKAMVTYENIVEEFTEDSEAYWGLVLCKYGIEYVDDPKTGKKIPTCHRTLTKSILNDDDYLNAVKYSDVIARALYEKEAKEIDRLQKEILVLSQKEEPYDIFICYKETDESGKRTKDSVIAQEIYEELIRKGYKVFFARITLESKLGSEYEPIIYAALTSSKVMLVIGTKIEYFNAVWVRNEWSRFIDMMHSDTHKYLIPCYKDIDAYDLPEEMLSYQCQDLNKLGFMQDLIRGLDKIFDRKEKIIVETNDHERYDNKKISNLIRRCELEIADLNYEKAEQLLDDALNLDPENSKIYILLLLMELDLREEKELEECNEYLTKYSNFNKALRFAKGDYKIKLERYNEIVSNRIINENNKKYYEEALKLYKNLNLELALEKLKETKNFDDAKILSKKINEELNLRKKFYEGIILEENKNNYEEALKVYNSIKDNVIDSKCYFSDDLLHHIHKCEEAICELEATFNEVLNKYNNKDYYGAVKAFKKINKYGDNLTYKDLKLYYDKCLKEIEKIKSEKYNNAVDCMLKENYLAASYIFKEITDYKDSNELMKECNELAVSKENYEKAKKIVSVKTIGNYYDAIDLLEKNKTYKDSSALIRLYRSEIAKINRKAKLKILSSIVVLIIVTVVMFTVIIPTINLNKARNLINEGSLTESEEILTNLNGFGDSENLLEIIKAHKEFSNNNYEEGIEYLDTIGTTIQIDYNPNEGELLEVDGQTVACKDGYTFYGWLIDSYDINNKKNNYYANVCLKASWEVITYDITYELNNGTMNININRYDCTQEVHIPNATKEGYTFIGWNDGKATKKDYVINKNTYGNINLEAIFEPNKYTIYLDYNGGIGDKESIEIKYDEFYNLPVSTKEGYTFIGWYDNNILVEDDIYKITNDLYLQARYELITYDISYILNEGIISNGPTLFNCTQEVHIPNATKEGYTFIGWNDGKATKKDYVINKNTYGNINLEAIFEPNKYTIYLDYNGGIGDKESIEIKYDEFYNLPVPVSTKDGYKFIGWYDENILVEDDIYKITNDLYLQARYEYIYYVTYNLDGGECNNLPTEFTESTKFNLPTPTKQGYIFLGWYDENDELVSELNNKDYTLIAKYGLYIKKDNYIYFGRYPQTKVTDSYIINALNQIITINEYGYIEYDGNEYKEYNDNYYLVEPIKWKILETNNNSYKLVSDLILDQQDFYSSIYSSTINGKEINPNNYEYSDIRSWLNNEFINASFNTEEQNIIYESLVDNSASTTYSYTNEYACNNTNDKIYLLSYKDVTENYFTTRSRKAKVTDYAKDKGVYESNDYGNFWLRSPYYFNSGNIVHYVGDDGNIHHYYCNYSIVGARPALEIKIK